MTTRAFWLNLGWLVMLVLTVAVPLGLDAVGRLTYFWPRPVGYSDSLPVAGFQSAHGGGTGRRRRALRYSVGTIVVLGIVLDFVLGFLTLRFPGCNGPASSSPYLWCLPAVHGRIPIEGFCST